jgi:hypothetical protein
MAYNVQVCDAVSDGIYYLLGSDTVSAVTMIPTYFQAAFDIFTLTISCECYKMRKFAEKHGKLPVEHKISNATSKFLDSIADLGEWECN